MRRVAAAVVVAALAAAAPASSARSDRFVLRPLVTNTKTTLSSIQSSSSDLKKGFDDADSCKQLKRSS